MRHWEAFAFAIGAALVVFLGGIIVGKYQLWPYDYLNGAKDAAQATWIKYFPDEKPEFVSPYRTGGVTRYERDAAQDGVTFIPMRSKEGAGAVLVDMEGKVLQRWKLNFSDAFPGDAPHIISRAPDEQIAWHGVQLLPNGDVLLNLEGGNFPFGGGLVMIDRNSKIKWKLARNTHHDIDILKDSRIVVLDHEYAKNGITSCSAYVKEPYLADRVLTVSAEGEEIGSFSLADAFCRSPYKWMLMPVGVYSQRPPVRPDVEDLLHANNVEVIRPEQAAIFTMGNEGDYLVSFRNLNMVAVVDKDTKLMKWALMGNFARQHDPDIMPNGNLLIYDNLGGMVDGERPQGRSRILEINPATQQIVWKYEGSPSPTERFDSPKGGNVQLLPNGNVLVSHSWQGRAFEITREPQPRIVWEYVNLLEANESGGMVGAVTDAKRFDRAALPFLGAPTS